MVPISMSRASKVTVEWTGKPFASRSWVSLVLMTCDGLREFRFTERQQRLLLQLPGKKPDPDAAERQKRCQIPPRRESARSEFGTRPPVDVETTHGNEPPS